MRDCTCLGVCRGAHGLGVGWQCVLTKAPEHPPSRFVEQLSDLQALVTAQAAQLETVRQENEDLKKELLARVERGATTPGRMADACQSCGGTRRIHSHNDICQDCANVSSAVVSKDGGDVDITDDDMAKILDGFTESGLCGCGYRQSLHHVDREEGGIYCLIAKLRQYLSNYQAEQKRAEAHLAAQLETVRQENQDLIEENNEFRDHLLTQSALVDALTNERDELLACVGPPVVTIERLTRENRDLRARVASLEAGAAPTGTSAEVQSGAATAAERTEQGTICPVCKEPALQSWNRVDSDDCGVLCLACGAEFAPARNEEEPLAAAPR